MEIFIATSNKNKVKEFKDMLEPKGYSIKSLNDLDEEIEIEENGQTFEENAIIKASTIAKRFNIVAISDDSGLEIDALNKEPGIYSARYLGHDTSYDYKNSQILLKLKNETNRDCRYVCSIAICYPSGENHVFTGILEGSIAYEMSGSNGFGYDPIFYYEPFKTTLANVPSDLKNQVSHRHIALMKLLEYLDAKE